MPRRNRESEMVVFGDGGGFVRLYEVRINPLVRVASVLVLSAARLLEGLGRASSGVSGFSKLGFTLTVL